MSYTVNIPLEVAVHFPDLCPFTGKPSPTGRMRLKTTRTTSMLPIPGVGLYNRYRQGGIALPVTKSIAVTYVVLQLLPFAIFGGGIGLCFLLNNTPYERVGGIAAVLGIPLALFAFIFRLWFFRKVRVADLHESHLELRFGSENYARQFGELNNLPVME